MNGPADPRLAIADLLRRAGIDGLVRDVIACRSGGNNRIYRVHTDAGQFVAKAYFRHQGDMRDRLASEYAFLTYAQSAAPGVTPRPIACSAEQGIALYEFVRGRHLEAGQIGEPEVDAAVDFFRALNAAPARAAGLPIASEACFTIADHLALIRGRVDRLLDAAPASAVDQEGVRFFRRLDGFWRVLSDRILAEARRQGVDVQAPLGPDRRCVSPSDFGFHNALVEDSGRIRFLDFEYAGWDDPAKVAGDFFAQLAVPVPVDFFDRFVTGIVQGRRDAQELIDRAVLLRPAYRVKWCCIALNVFLPVDLARRRFSDPGLDETVLKRRQLARAEQLLNSIET